MASGDLVEGMKVRIASILSIRVSTRGGLQVVVARVRYLS